MWSLKRELVILKYDPKLTTCLKWIPIIVNILFLPNWLSPQLPQWAFMVCVLWHQEERSFCRLWKDRADEALLYLWRVGGSYLVNWHRMASFSAFQLKVQIKRPPGIGAWKKWTEAKSDSRSNFHNNRRTIRSVQLTIHVSPGCILTWYTLQEQHDITGNTKHVRESLCNRTQELIADLHTYIISCRCISGAK